MRHGLCKLIDAIINEFCNLPNSNCSSLITQRETTKLRVIDEALNTDWEGRFYQCYNFLALPRELRRLLRFASGSLVKVVE